jgi:hypothetical protein
MNKMSKYTDREAIELTRKDIIMWRSYFTGVKKVLDDFYTKDYLWDCTAVLALTNIYRKIDDFLDDTDPENNEDYCVEE